MKNNPSIKTILKLLFAFSLIAWFLYKNDLSKITQSILSISMWMYLTSVFLIFLAVWLNSVKWFVILPKYKIIKLFESNMIGQFYGLILPGQLLGDGAKAYIFGKGKDDTEKIWVSVFFDKITGIIGLLILGIFGLVFTREALPIWFVWGLLASTGFGFLILFLIRLKFFYNFIMRVLLKLKQKLVKFNKLFELFSKLVDAWYIYTRKTKIVFLSILLGVVYQIMGIVINMILANEFDINVSFVDWCWLLAVVSILLLLPLTIGGIGIREGSLIGLLGWLGVTSEKALALSFSIFSLQIILAIVGGLLDHKLIMKKN